MSQIYLITELKKYIGRFQGQGINHEQEAFTGRLDLSEAVGGKGINLKFVATGKDGTIFHEESSMLAPSMDEKLCLWNFNSNIPGMLAHTLSSFKSFDDGLVAEFIFGDLDDKSQFRERINLTLYKNGNINYSYSWGMPSGDFAERSAVTMVPDNQTGKVDLNHLHLAVKDLERSKEFYSKHFGFRERCQHGKCLFMANDQGFDLALDPECTPEELPKWFHVGVRVPSISGIKELYKTFDASKKNISRDLEEYDDLVFFHAVDPDGYKIECYWE